MTGRTRPRDPAEEESGAGQVITFLIAFAIFVPAFTLLLAFARDTTDSTNTRVADLDTKARIVLDGLVSEPGRPWDWETLPQPHVLEKAGLREVDRNALAYAKLNRLHGAALTASATDGKLNYEECRDTLGLGSAYAFHLRSYPVFEASAANGWGTEHLPPVRVAYIGHFDGNWNGVTRTPGIEASSSTRERAALASLSVLFENRVYLPAGSLAPEQSGDVYPDHDAEPLDDVDGPLGSTKAYLTAALFESGRVDDYDVIVVGSDVDQADLDNLKQEFRAWVDAGKYLVILGSDVADEGWVTGGGPNPGLLESGASTGGSSGPLTTPDDSHAFLTTPNRLDVPGYANHYGLSWNFQAVTDYAILMSTSSPAENEVVLALSNEGRYQNGGAAVVSSLELHELTSAEASKFLANALVYKFLRAAYIDYGPEMAPDALARSATRIAPIEVASGRTFDAKIVMFLWRVA